MLGRRPTYVHGESAVFDDGATESPEIAVDEGASVALLVGCGHEHRVGLRRCLDISRDNLLDGPVWSEKVSECCIRKRTEHN